MCQSKRKIVCYDPTATPKDWWLEAWSMKKEKKVLTHVLYKQAAELEPIIPTCEKCNCTV